MAVTQQDRERFFNLMNEKNLSWDAFWETWDDSDVELMLVHGG